MDTDSWYPPLAEKEQKDCIRPEMKAEWEQQRSGQNVVPIVSLLMQLEFLSGKSVVTSTKNMSSEVLVFSKRSSGVLKCCVFVVRVTAATTKPLIGWNSAPKGLNKRTLEQSGGGPLEKCRTVPGERVNITSTNRGFRTKDHTIATCERTKRGL